MKTIIKQLRLLADGAIVPANFEGARQGLAYLLELIAAYDALAPKPDDWPDGAEWFTVNIDDEAGWWADEPDYDGGFWYHDIRGPLVAGDLDIPPDIPPSWCKWRRTEAI